MRLWFLLFSLVASLDFAWGKIFEKCELASDLETKYNVSREEVKSLVCIAEFESTFNSGAINHFNWDGSKDFGLFQLNNKYWCGKETGQNVCRTSCESFLDDDLTDDLRCVQTIVKDTKRWMKVTNGYVAWVAYVNRCQNRNLDEYMSECTLTTTTMATTTAPVATTSKQELTTSASRPTRIPVKTEEPIRTSQQKPDQVRGPQIPIFRPIPVRANKPQTDSQTQQGSEVASKPSKAHLKNFEGPFKDTLDLTIPQNVNPLSLSVVEQLLQILTDTMSQFDLQPLNVPSQTSQTKDVEVQLPNNAFTIHPQLHSQSVSDVGTNLENHSPVLHSPSEAQKEANLSNLLNEIFYGESLNTNTKNPSLNIFSGFPVTSPLKNFYTRIPTKGPAGIPIANNYPFRFSPIFGQIPLPYLTLNRHNYNADPLGYPFIGSQGIYPQFSMNGYGIYNPYQTHPLNRKVFI